jgi:drug/metabolite transporter (DMT)-like permease
LTPPAHNAEPAWIARFIALGAIWGSSFMFMHLAVAELGPLPTAALRVAFGALFLLPLLVWRGQAHLLGQRWLPVFFVGLLNSGIPFALFAFSLLTLTTGLSSIINASVPMFGALVAWLWLGEKPGAWRIVGLVLGFAGVTLLAWDQAGIKGEGSGLHPLWAIAACLGACTCRTCHRWLQPPAARSAPRWAWRYRLPTCGPLPRPAQWPGCRW